MGFEKSLGAAQGLAPPRRARPQHAVEPDARGLGRGGIEGVGGVDHGHHLAGPRGPSQQAEGQRGTAGGEGPRDLAEAPVREAPFQEPIEVGNARREAGEGLGRLPTAAKLGTEVAKQRVEASGRVRGGAAHGSIFAFSSSPCQPRMVGGLLLDDGLEQRQARRTLK